MSDEKPTTADWKQVDGQWVQVPRGAATETKLQEIERTTNVTKSTHPPFTTAKVKIPEAS